MSKIKNFSSFVIVVFLTIPLLSFNDFMDYWTVKVNGKTIYDSKTDKKYNKLFQYNEFLAAVTSKDTLEVEYFTDTPCANCIYNYFVSEHSEKNGEAFEYLKTYLKEQKSLGPKAYKVALKDIIRLGSKGTIKAIYYYKNSEHAIELCKINIKED